ncbi:MAG: hypothetical protein EZS28_027847, partial [Streblomastix strix]
KYDLLGYSIKTQASADIAPSITYIVKNGVTSIEIQNIPSNLTTAENSIAVSQTCTPSVSSAFLDTISLGLHKAGTTDNVCASNTAIPSDERKCANGDKSAVYFKGYKFVTFGAADVDTLKAAILRFGAVNLAKVGLVVGWDIIELQDRHMKNKDLQDVEQ